MQLLPIPPLKTHTHTHTKAKKQLRNERRTLSDSWLSQASGAGGIH